MRIDFEDKSFIEIRLGAPGKVVVILGAKKKNNALEIEINACEITINEFSQLVNGLGIQLPKIIKPTE
jgi:hypothetical protein